jgi:hypothetical protein
MRSTRRLPTTSQPTSRRERRKKRERSRKSPRRKRGELDMHCLISSYITFPSKVIHLLKSALLQPPLFTTPFGHTSHQTVLPFNMGCFQLLPITY